MFLDVSTALGGATGGRVLDLLVLGAVASVAYRFPRTAPYLAVFGAGLQSTLTHTLTSDGDVLAGLCLGLAVSRLRSRRGLLRPRVSRTLVALALLNVVVLLSYVANSRGPNGPQVALSTEYFVSRSGLAALVVLLSDEDSDWARRWSTAIGLFALTLGLVRLTELVGLPVKLATDALRINVLGDYADPSNANLFAVVLGIGIPLLLANFGAVTARIQPRATFRWIGAAIVALAMASTASRTAAVIVAAVIVVLLVSAHNATSRVAIGALAAIYVLGSFLPAVTVLQKPVLIASSSTVPDRVVATNQPPLVAPPQTLVGQPSPTAQIPHGAVPSIRPQWRSVLDRTSYRLEQTLRPAAAGSGHFVMFCGAAGGGGIGVGLVITVNGALVAQLRPADMTTYYQWHEVPIPDNLVQPGKPVVVDFNVVGSPDSTRDYFLVGGVNAISSGYGSRIWTGESWSEMDLSSDPGSQVGLFMVFMDGVIPPLTYSSEASSGAIDTSVGDRLTLWKTALNVFIHNPLLGTGFYSFGRVRSQYLPRGATLFFPYANAHSNYFQLLADLGAAGVLLFTLIFVLPLARLTRIVLADPRRMPWLQVAFALALVACLISSLTQTWIADSRFYLLSWFLALVAGGAAWSSDEKLTSQATNGDGIRSGATRIVGVSATSTRA
jgi:hypothetical protein